MEGVLPGLLFRTKSPALRGESMFTNILTRRVGKDAIIFGSSFPDRILALDIFLLVRRSSFKGPPFWRRTRGRDRHPFRPPAQHRLLWMRGPDHAEALPDGKPPFRKRDGHVMEYDLLVGQSLLVEIPAIWRLWPTPSPSAWRRQRRENALPGGEDLCHTRVTGSGHRRIPTMPWVLSVGKR